MVMLVRSPRWRYLLPAVAPLVLLVAVAWEATLSGAARPAVGRLMRLPLGALLGLVAAAGALALASDLGLGDGARAGGAVGLPGGSRLADRLGLTAAVGEHVAEAWLRLRRWPWILLPMVSVAGGVGGLVLLRGRARAALFVAIGLCGIALGSLNALTLEQRNRAADPRPFAREVKRIIGDAPIHYCCDDSLASHFHVYLDAPATLLDLAGAERLLREGSWRYLLIAARALPGLPRERLPDGGGRVLTEGRFGGYHFVLLGRE
jgi:hypothetical protein